MGNYEEMLFKLLSNICAKRPKEFDGLGIIVYEDIFGLPISPLKDSGNAIKLPISDYDQVTAALVGLCDSKNLNHDGFHLLSQEFTLTHVSQYFSTPIIPNISLEFLYGSRYRTALYGSYIKNVIACGVLSKNYSPTVFTKGKMVQ